MPKRSFLELVKHYLVLFLLVLLTSVLMILSLVVSAILTWGGAWIESFIGGAAWVLSFIHLAVSLGLLTLLFGLLFKLLPEAKVRWRHAFISASVTSILFIMGRYLIGLYLGRSAVGSAYGAAGSLVVLLLWVFYAAQIFLFGVELVKVQSQDQGKNVAGNSSKVGENKKATTFSIGAVMLASLALFSIWIKKNRR